MLNAIRRPPPGPAPVPFFVEVGYSGVYLGGWSFPDGHVVLTLNSKVGFETNEEELARWLPLLAQILSPPSDPSYRLKGKSDDNLMQGRAIAGLIARHRDEFARLLAAERLAIKTGPGDSTHWGAR